MGSAGILPALSGIRAGQPDVPSVNFILDESRPPAGMPEVTGWKPALPVSHSLRLHIFTQDPGCG